MNESEKLVVRVLRWLCAGLTTSKDISAVSGLSVATASSVLSSLANKGIISSTGRFKRYGRRGPACIVYSAAPPANPPKRVGLKERLGFK